MHGSRACSYACARGLPREDGKTYHSDQCCPISSFSFRRGSSILSPSCLRQICRFGVLFADLLSKQYQVCCWNLSNPRHNLGSLNRKYTSDRQSCSLLHDQIITGFLQCDPISSMWDRRVKGTCNVDQRKWFLGVSVPNTLMDIVIVLLPFPYLMKLNTQPGQKVVLAGIFLMGGL